MKDKSMKRSVIGVCLGCMVLLFTAACQSTGTGQTAQVQETGYEQISQEEAKELMDTREDAVVLDVRTREEYEEAHIPDAICVPNESIQDTMPEELPDKDQLILVYCRSGNRSRQAAEKLSALGYTNVMEFGGINTWPYETE